MTFIKRLALLLFVTVAAKPLPAEYLWEGFEKENLWLIAAMEENAVLSMKPETAYSTEGERSLMLGLDKTSWALKGLVAREGLFDLSGIDGISFDVLSEMSVSVSVGLSTGKENEWFESRPFSLRRGWNRDLKVNFQEKKWKSRASLWENTVLPQNLNDTRKIAISFFNGEKGNVYIDNIRFSGAPAVNAAYRIPYEPAEGLTVSNALFLLEGALPDPSAKAHTRPVLLRSNGFTLPYADIDNVSKAIFSVSREMDWRHISKMRLKVFNPHERTVFFAVSFQTLAGLIWYETPQHILRSGRTNEIAVNLNAPYFKSEMTRWKYSSHLYNKDQIRSINLLVYGAYGKKSTGEVLITALDLVKGREFLPKREAVLPAYLFTGERKNYRPPVLRRPAGFPAGVKKHEKFELNLFITNQYVNPFNPEEIFIEAVFTGPGKKNFRVPGYYHAGFARTGNEKKEKELEWRIRFAPAEEGLWEFKIRITNLAGQLKAGEKAWRFQCLPSSNRGIIRTRGTSFVDQEGKVFYPVGQSLGWVLSEDKTSIGGYLEKFFKAGINFTRIWNADWGWTLEWSSPRASGLGRYSERDADELDRIMEECEKKGIYVQFCLNNFRDLWPGYQWETNPYNEQNGGPLKEPGAFFTNVTAKKFFKQRLLYILARWSYSPALFSWELFNEVDLSGGYSEEAALKWHEEMGRFIASADPAHHMVTTSFSRRMAGEKIYRLKEISYSQTHVYTEDFRQALFEIPRIKMRQFNKPHLTGEIGGSVETGSEEKKDEKGIRVHNALWYSFLSGAPASALYWWWDDYIDHNGLYYHFRTFQNLTGDFKHEEAERVPVRLESTNRGSYFFAPVLDWEKGTGSRFTMRNNDLSGEGLLSKYLQGQYQKGLMQEPEFHIPFPSDGKFQMLVETASFMGASFSVSLDGRQVMTNSFGEQKSRVENAVNRLFEIPVPGGEHVIRLKSTGMDWMKIRYFLFSGCVPDVEAYGIRSRGVVFIWLRNRGFTIQNDLDQKEIFPSSPGFLEIENFFREENLKVSVFDIWEEKALRIADIKAQRTKIRLEYPSVHKDILIRIEKSRSIE